MTDQGLAALRQAAVAADWEQRHARWRRFGAIGMRTVYPVLFHQLVDPGLTQHLDSIARRRGFTDWRAVSTLAKTVLRTSP